MARGDGKLSDTTIKNAKPGEAPSKLADGRGLYLLIQPSGSKLWRLKYRVAGKEKLLALGQYPDVTLSAARKRTTEARGQLAEGVDPGEAKKAARSAAEARSMNCFEAIAREWIAVKGAGWAPTNAGKIIGRFEADLFPYLGARPVSAIAAPELLACLRRIEARGAVDTAHRVRQTCGQVFRYAIATGRAERDPAADLRGALGKVKGGHFAAFIEAAPLGELLRAIEGYRGDYTTRAALKFAPLVFVRPGELRHAEWAAFDLDGGTWRYFVTKTKADHIVPLAAQAVAVLRELHPLTGNGRYVFPSTRTASRPMSENTVTGALRRLGYAAGTVTGHGFRATARTMLAELGWKTDAIERQLAHKASGPLKGAYDRAQFLDERRKMMQAWADYLDALRDGRRVIAGRFGLAA